MSAQPLAGHNKKVISCSRRILCFVSPTGKDKIRDWYDDLGPAERATADAFIKTVLRKQDWVMPYYLPALSGSKDLKRIGELRWICNNVNHRLVGYLMNGVDFAAMIGCTHKQQVYNPASALETAITRRKQIGRKEGTLREYDF